MSVVTPLDVAASVDRALWVRDRGIGAGVAEAKDSSYEISFIDSYGVSLAPRETVPSAGELTIVPLPRSLTTGLVVLHVRALRHGVASPRPCDVHVMIEGSVARVIGVRH